MLPNGGSSNDSGSTFDPAIQNLSAQHLRDSAVETGNGKIDAKSDIQTKLGENESNDAIFSPKLPQDHVRMNSSSGSGESSTSTSNSQGERQTEVKIGNQSNCDPESDNLQGETGSNRRPVKAQNQRTVLSNIRDSTVTEISSEEKRRIRCRELMAGLHPPNRTNSRFWVCIGLRVAKFHHKLRIRACFGPKIATKDQFKRIQAKRH